MLKLINSQNNVKASNPPKERHVPLYKNNWLKKLHEYNCGIFAKNAGISTTNLKQT